MSQLRVRALSDAELDGTEELLDGITEGDEARASLLRLGGLEENALAFGDGWAASVELDGTTLLVRGEPAGADAHWTIYGRPGTKDGMHAARRLQGLVGEESQR